MVEKEEIAAAIPCGAEKVVKPSVSITTSPEPVNDAEHLHRLQEVFTLGCKPDLARRRRAARRRRQGKLQRAIRRDVVTFYRLLNERGTTLEQAAERLAIKPRTLRQWQGRVPIELSYETSVGRPAARSGRDTRQAVLDFIKEQGPGVSVRSLQTQFPDLARAELDDLLRRCRHVLHRRYPTCSRLLQWQAPGRVWAIDWAEPSADGSVLPPIDGTFPYLLAVRDLASGYQIAWLPVRQPTTEVAVHILANIFAELGKPLVLKSDNGASFRSQEMKNFLERAGVFSLFSPPHWPGYNGAIEAAIGSLKTRTARAAASHGHEHWMTWDVDSALREANRSFPRRLHGRTPLELWRERSTITAVERVRFELAVYRHRYLTSTELGISPQEELDHWQNARIDRQAFQRALVEHGYLLFKGRRYPLTVSPGKVTFIV